MSLFDLIRLVVAWIISPFVFVVFVPIFCFFDFMVREKGSHRDLIDAWKYEAFMQYKDR